MSACHISLGSSASKRISEERGRFCGCGETRPSRLRIRQIVETDGTCLKHGDRSAGAPASLLCDNGAVFTATPRGGKVLLQSELERLGIAAKNSRPYRPQTCGKVERLHQTLKRYLANQASAETLGGLQEQLDCFTAYYNTTRPHRALGGYQPIGGD
jgi:transposase InsO family protein